MRAIQETPVQSAITSLNHVQIDAAEARTRLQVYGNEEDVIHIKGYAYSGGGRAIERVDVSVDGGHTFRPATLLPDDSRGHKAWSWRLWECTIPRHQVGLEICCRAVDEAYNVQPETMSPIYDRKGNLATAWQCVLSRGFV